MFVTTNASGGAIITATADELHSLASAVHAIACADRTNEIIVTIDRQIIVLRKAQTDL